MRKIILSIMVSVDGFIESRTPEEDWFNWNEEMGEYMTGLMNNCDAFIYGRKSYQLMLQYWPQATGDFADIMNGKPKLVFSKTLKTVEWNSTLMTDVNKAEIEDLKSRPGKDMVLFAGADIASAFIKEGLIDEFRLIVNPIVLGGGKPLFTHITENLNLQLKSAKAFECGNVLLTYWPK